MAYWDILFFENCKKSKEENKPLTTLKDMISPDNADNGEEKKE